MATAAENLQTAYDNIARQLAELTLHPKPSYSENGRLISWGEHFNNLTNQLNLLHERLIKEEGPFDILV